MCLPGTLLAVLRAIQARFTALLIDRSKHTLSPVQFVHEICCFRLRARRLESYAYGRAWGMGLLIVATNLPVRKSIAELGEFARARQAEQ